MGKKTNAGGAFGASFRKRLAEEKGSRSAAALAEKCGIDPAQLSEWVNGRQLPGFDSLRTLGEKLDLSLNWLIWGIGPKNRNQDDVLTAVQRRLRDRGVPTKAIRLVDSSKLIDLTVDAVQRELEVYAAYERDVEVIQRAYDCISINVPKARSLVDRLAQLEQRLTGRALRQPASLGIVKTELRSKADPRGKF